MRPFNNYKRTKYWRGSGQVLVHPVYGTRECDCHVCRIWRYERRTARKASRELGRRAVREAWAQAAAERDDEQGVGR